MRLKNFNTYFFFAVLVLVGIGVYQMFAPYLSALFVAAVLAVVLHGIYTWFSRVCGGRNIAGASIVTVLVLVALVLPALGVVGAVSREAVELVGGATTEGTKEYKIVSKVVDIVKETPWVATYLQAPERIFSNEQVREALTTVGQRALSFVGKTVQSTVGLIVWIFVMLFGLFYLLLDGKRLVKWVMYLSPLTDAHEKILISRFVSMARATLKGTVVIGIIQGILGGITFVIAGVISPVIWTVLMIVLSIIPAVGPALVMVPVGLVMLLVGYTWQGILILLMTVVVSTIDNVLRPKLVGKDTQMHTLLVFFATLGGLSVFGLVGFIVGPIIMALFIALLDIYGLEFKEQLEKYNTRSSH